MEVSPLVWIFFENITCGDGICNYGETCSSCAIDCACSSGYQCVGGICQIIVIPPSGGGGGGGVSCTYDWVCSEWYPEPCPEDGIQNRVCVNRGTCTGIVGKPEAERTCTFVQLAPTEPLFDLFVTVPTRYKYIGEKEAVGFNLRLVNVGNATTIDVFFKYWVTNENDTLIAETQETRAIGEEDEFEVRMLLPENLGEGTYKVYAQITYDADKIAIGGDSFEIITSPEVLLLKKVLSFPYFLIPIGVLVFIILIIILIKRRKKKGKKSKKKEKVKRKKKKLKKKKKKVKPFFHKPKKSVAKKKVRKKKVKKKTQKIKKKKKSKKKQNRKKIKKRLGKKKKEIKLTKEEEAMEKIRKERLKELKEKINS